MYSCIKKFCGSSLALQGGVVDCANKELAEFGLGLADALYDEGYVREWIKNHIH
jgi:hypothetical protein